MFYKSCVQKLENRAATSKSKTSSKSEPPGRVRSRGGQANQTASSAERITREADND